MDVVLDTNVLISGIFFSGPPSKILKAWRDGEVQLLVSPEIVDEYVRVSKLLGKEFPSVEIDAVLMALIAHSKTIEASPLTERVSNDPDDDKFLACAIAGGGAAIVSGDRHLLRL